MNANVMQMQLDCNKDCANATNLQLQDTRIRNLFAFRA